MWNSFGAFRALCGGHLKRAHQWLHSFGLTGAGVAFLLAMGGSPFGTAFAFEPNSGVSSPRLGWPIERPTVMPSSGVLPALLERQSADPWTSGQPGTSLPPNVLRVSRIANWNGDRSYIVVDKSLGRIVLFTDGAVTLDRPALTGASRADEFPPDALGKSLTMRSDVRYKVTPAGRFTVSRGFDRGLGPVLDINEIRGRGWGLAIHRAWLGNEAEHRDARLRSVTSVDKHITSGCIDVDVATMGELLRLLPSARTPIYILPNDEILISSLFRARVAARPLVDEPARFDFLGPQVSTFIR